MVYILSKFWNSENRYKEVTTPIKISHRMLDLLYDNAILIFFFFFANAECLADHPEDPEMGLVDPESPKFCMILWSIS